VASGFCVDNVVRERETSTGKERSQAARARRAVIGTIRLVSRFEGCVMSSTKAIRMTRNVLKDNHVMTGAHVGAEVHSHSVLHLSWPPSRGTPYTG
jgi:hypothetical protein